MAIQLLNKFFPVLFDDNWTLNKREEVALFRSVDIVELFFMSTEELSNENHKLFAKLS